MKLNWLAAFLIVGSRVLAAQDAKPFTLEQVLSAPYSVGLTAAPVGGSFAWVENASGRRNLWVGGAGMAARQLTHFTEDDAQDIAGLAWSPDAKWIAYTYGAESGADGKPANPAHLQRPVPVELWLQPVDGGAAIRVGDGRAPLFTRDGKGLLFVRAGQVWMVDIGELALQPRSPSARDLGHPLSSQQVVFDRGSASGMTLSPDGTMLAFVSRRGEVNEPSHSFIALFDFKTKVLRMVAPSTGVDSAPVFSPDGKEIAWLRAPFTEAKEFELNRVSAYPWSVQVAEVAGGPARTVWMPPAGKFGSVLPRMSTGSPRVMWAAGGKLLFFSEPDAWVHVWSVDAHIKDAKPVLLTPGKFEVEDAVVSADGKTLLWASSSDGPDKSDQDRRHLWKLDLTSADAKPQALTSGKEIETHPQMAADGTVAALIASARLPMHPALVGADGALKPMGGTAVPVDYPAEKLVVPTQVTFHASDGLLVHGQLFLPSGKAEGKRAALIFVHGGPRRQMLLGYPGMDYYSNSYAMNQYLVSRGFVVLSVNYRCGIGYGLEFRQCVRQGAMGGNEYNDVLAGLAYLRTRADIDMKRVGIWGGSYGGYLTAMALARNSDLFAAGVDFHGVHEWVLEDNAPTDWWRGTNAEKDAIGVKAHASSPMGDIAKWKSPVLLIHGDNDPEVAYAQTPVLADALRAHHVPMEEMVFPDEVHGFLLHKDWLAAYEKEAEFFERVLKP